MRASLHRRENSCSWTGTFGRCSGAWLWGLIAFLGVQPAWATTPGEWMVRLTVDGQELEGSPISWSEQEIHLLGRDGRLWTLKPDQTLELPPTTSKFQCYSPSEFRAALLRELGDTYQVSGTGHYMVAHPRGTGDRWAQRFEDLYRTFVRYFAVRDFQATAPPFPLVSVVYKDRAAFAKQAAAQNNGATPNGVLGYYDLNSNRILLYDMGGRNDARWQQNASVLIHEATHQMAFNTGVHSRYAPPPLWAAEGLATMFEAPGIYDAGNYPHPNDRLNHGRLRTFQEALAPNHRPEMLLALIATDDLFRVNPAAAYAEAWALTYFLATTEPAKYAAYLKLTANRPPFSEYSSAARVKDFAAIFGSNWRMLEARFLRFMSALR